MTGWVNQHSYLLLILAILGLALVATSPINRLWLRGLVLGSVVVFLMVGYLGLRTGSSTLTSEGEVNSALAGSTPILMEFYSDY